MKNYAILKKKCETIEKQRINEKNKYEKEMDILKFKLKETQN